MPATSRAPKPAAPRIKPVTPRTHACNPTPLRYVGMIIGLSTQLVPNLLVQIAIIMAIKVSFSGLTLPLTPTPTPPQP